VLTLINAERASAGLGALLLDLGLDAAAEAHSLDLATNNCFKHDSCNGTNWATRIKTYYTPNTFLGEIIAAGQPDPTSVVAAWMNSDGHRANILGANFTVAGVGLVNGLVGSSYRTYWTVDFGGATTPQTVLSAIPEPATWALGLMGLAGLAVVCRQRA
jgi:MYXO-CTERM domain-containing protein